MTISDALIFRDISPEIDDKTKIDFNSLRNITQRQILIYFRKIENSPNSRLKSHYKDEVKRIVNGELNYFRDNKL